MKKIFSMLLLVGALFATSCDKDEEEETPTGYVGELYTGKIAEYDITGMGKITIPEQSDVKVYFDTDGTISQLTFAQTTFTGTTITVPYVGNVTGMPKCDIVIPEIDLDSSETTADTNVYKATDVTPKMLDGDTFSDATKQKIKSITVDESKTDDTIEAEVECDLLISMGGDTEYPVTITLNYTGTK